MIEKISKKSIIVIDTETNGGHPLIHNIIMLQLGVPEDEDQYIIDCRDTDIKELKNLLENPNILFIGHNIKFDYNMLKQYGIILHKVYDTMIAEQCIYNGKYTMLEIRKQKRFSLAGVYKHYFGKRIDKDTRTEFLHVFDKPFTTKQVLYGANDVIFPAEIKEKQDELAKLYEIEDYIRFENKNVLSVGDMEYNGVLVDIDKWKEVLKDYNTAAKLTVIELDKCLLKQPKSQKYKLNANQLCLFGESSDRLTTVNWKSTKQVLEILKDIFDINPIDKHGKISSGKGALTILDPYKSVEIVKLILKYREEEKILNSFGSAYLKKYIDHDGKIRTSFNQIVATGRMSSRNPNIQQIPRGNNHRSCFIASPGYVLSVGDFDNQEARIAADFSKDEALLHFFKEKNNYDGDLHAFVATKIFSVKYKKDLKISRTENAELRQLGKTLDFSIMFGTSAYGLALSCGITEAEAQEMIDLYFVTFPKLKELFDKAKSFGLENGYITTNPIIKFKRWFPDWKRFKELSSKRNLSREDFRELSKLRGGIERRSQNSIIQGTASIITKLALILLRDELLKNNILPLQDAAVKILLSIHDEIVLEVRKDLADIWVKKHKECMEKAGAFMCKNIVIKANPVINDFWAH